MSLPNDYTQLEYILSSGTQYINTGFCPKADTRVVADVFIPNYAVTACFYGSRGNSCDFGVANVGDTYTYLYYGSAYIRNTTAIYTNVQHSIDQNGNTLILVRSSGTKTLSVADATFNGVSPYPLYVCACNNEGIASDFALIKVYSFQIYDGETLVRDFIPAQNNEGINGLYDLVNGKFYTNQGTGLFMSNLPGNYKGVPPNEYTKLEYIQSDGTQYIDTDFHPTANTRVAAETHINISKTAAQIYGAISTGQDFCCNINGTPQWKVFYGTKNSTSTSITQGLRSVTIDHIGHHATIVDTGTKIVNCKVPKFDGVNPYSLYIFTNNNGGVTDVLSSFSLYSMRIYDEGVLVRWFVPVKRKSDGEIGLYDVENGVFYTNQGTGTFIAGPELEDDPWEEPEEPDTPALVIGEDMRITEGMTVIGGVLHRIVLS